MKMNKIERKKKENKRKREENMIDERKAVERKRHRVCDRVGLVQSVACPPLAQ